MDIVLESKRYSQQQQLIPQKSYQQQPVLKKINILITTKGSPQNLLHSTHPKVGLMSEVKWLMCTNTLCKVPSGPPNLIALLDCCMPALFNAR